MEMKKTLVFSGMGALAAMTGCSPTQPQKPNIVFFFADDIGVECFGCYGGAEYETPHIDSLASQGIMYTNMNAMPLSSPSRVQVMTGLYNDRNYVCFGYLNDDENTFAHLAQDAGYSTAIVGKWQMGRSREMVPKLGFDESFHGKGFGFGQIDFLAVDVEQQRRHIRKDLPVFQGHVECFGYQLSLYQLEVLLEVIHQGLVGVFAFAQVILGQFTEFFQVAVSGNDFDQITGTAHGPAEFGVVGRSEDVQNAVDAVASDGKLCGVPHEPLDAALIALGCQLDGVAGNVEGNQLLVRKFLIQFAGVIAFAAASI